MDIYVLRLTLTFFNSTDGKPQPHLATNNWKSKIDNLMNN